MEELRPEELEELVQELEGESEEEEALSPEVEELLRDLQQASWWMIRQGAALRLGKLSESSPRIVQSLIAAAESDSRPGVREAAMESLRAPVHQELLQEYPDLMQRAQAATEQTATQRAAVKAREVHNRKQPKVELWIPVFIAFGIVWMVVSGKATSGTLGHLLLALPGVGLVALGLWKWRSATIDRNVLSRSAKETVGTVEGKRKEKHEDDYGSSYTYHVTVRFEAEDATRGTRVMVLNAQVARRLWKGLRSGKSVGIRYAAEDPRIAQIEGE